MGSPTSGLRILPASKRGLGLFLFARFAAILCLTLSVTAPSPPKNRGIKSQRPHHTFIAGDFIGAAMKIVASMSTQAAHNDPKKATDHPNAFHHHTKLWFPHQCLNIAQGVPASSPVVARLRGDANLSKCAASCLFTISLGTSGASGTEGKCERSACLRRALACSMWDLKPKPSNPGPMGPKVDRHRPKT